MKRFLFILAVLLAVPSLARAADGGTVSEPAAYRRIQEIVRVLQGNLAPEKVFAPAFLSAVPPAQLDAIARQLVAANGALLGAENVRDDGKGGTTFDIVYAHGRGPAQIHLGPAPRFLVTGFNIGAVLPANDTPQKILEDIEALPGVTGVGIYELDKTGPVPILLRDADRQMAIGSAFKLYVLSALAREIAAGKRRWSDVVPLGARSLPGGTMQEWPEQAPVTLQTLATMMISISDNTATDTLMRLLGREAIAAEVVASGHSAPSRMLPMLTTIEAFALKAGDPARAAEYARADDKAQFAMLDRWAPVLTRENVDPGRLATPQPLAIDSIEWFASAHDIARILARLRDGGDPAVLQILSVNPSIPEQEATYWDYVGYKGGSESGVLNLSWLLKDKRGRWLAIAATWNNAEKNVDDTKLELLALRLMRMFHP